MNGCVNKNKEFYSLAKEHGIDGGELELIIHKYWNEGGKVDSFPSTLYISEQLGIGKTYYESGENVRKLWERDYSEPIIVNSESELSASVTKAKTFFPADAITTYKDNKGNFVLRIAEPVTSSSIDKEIQDILAKASRDGQGRLLAPNGKLSNLTEKQYAQVRTKAFKDWFGDWERRATNFLGESTGNIDIADIINADGSINFKVLEEITDEYFNNADEKLFNKGRKTLRQRREKHYDGNGNLIENNTLEHLQNVTKSALASNIRPDLKPQLILAAALHDLAKPFHGGQIHGFQSLNLVNKLFKGNISPLVKFAIKHHMLTTEENKKFSIDDATRIMQEALDNNLNLDDAIEILLAINTADILSGQSEDSIDYYSKKSKRDTINEEIPFKKSLLVQAKNKLNDVSKVVDENGEPLVVYHSSINYFTTFSHDFGKTKTGAKDSKDLFFFMKDKEGSSWYSIEDWLHSNGKNHSVYNVEELIRELSDSLFKGVSYTKKPLTITYENGYEEDAGAIYYYSNGVIDNATDVFVDGI